MKSSFRIVLATLVGFLCGVMGFHTRPIKAQEPGSVHVFIRPLELENDKASRSIDLPGGRIVGISCVSNPQTRLPKAVTCYVATSLQ